MEQQILKLLEEINLRLSRVETQLSEQRSPEEGEIIIDKYKAASLLECHPNTLKTYRQEWIEGVHYFGAGKGKITYNKPLIMDWLMNRNDPASHQQAIAAWNSQRLCNQKTRRRTKP